ncbi:MAG: TonB-dependent receptor [Chitinophagaceae bacterium]
MIKRVILSCFFLVFISASCFAEAGASVSGSVVDAVSKQPLEFSNVSVLQVKDSSLVKGAFTDAKGNFTVEGLHVGTYLVGISFIGYEKRYVSVLVEAEYGKYKIGIIEIASGSKASNDVLVTGKRGALMANIDRKVYLVAQDIAAQSGAASNILKNIPSVEVDIDGLVSLRGSGDVVILINGQPSPLMGKSRAAVLQQLPANSIERIEVITNPSARFKPDGTAGIINIVLKKNLKTGFNGNIVLSGGNRSRYGSAVGFNYKPGKLNVFGNYAIRKDARIRTNDIQRSYLDSFTHALKSSYTENSYSTAGPFSHLLTLGMGYDPDKFNSLGISGDYSSRDQKRRDLVNKSFYDAQQKLTNQYTRQRYDPEIQKEKDVTAFWEHRFPKEDHSIRLEANFSSEREAEDNHYTNRYSIPSVSTSSDNTLIKQNQDQQQVTLDYSNPLTEDSKLEAGYSGSFSKQDFDFYGEYYNSASGSFVKDLQKSNRFIYNENINAFYATYERSFDKFGFSLGLRAEEVSIKGRQVTKDSTINNQYFKLYPTLHLAYKLKNGEVQLNYSRRIHRPEGDDINPFPEYQDPYNVRSGNPYLKPEIIHSVETGYKWQGKNFSFIPSLYYRYKQNGFTNIIRALNDSVLLTSIQNLSNDQSAGLELIFTAKAGNFFSANFSTNLFYNIIDASSLGYSNRKSIYSMSNILNCTFTITKNTMAQLGSNYRSARQTPQGKNYAVFVSNIGLRQDFFKKKASVTFTISDLLNTQKQRTDITTPWLVQTSIGRRDARIFNLALSYRFGKLIKKTENEKFKFDNGL